MVDSPGLRAFLRANADQSGAYPAWRVGSEYRGSDAPSTGRGRQQRVKDWLETLNFIYLFDDERGEPMVGLREPLTDGVDGGAVAAPDPPPGLGIVGVHGDDHTAAVHGLRARLHLLLDSCEHTTDELRRALAMLTQEDEQPRAREPEPTQSSALSDLP